MIPTAGLLKVFFSRHTLKTVYNTSIKVHYLLVVPAILSGQSSRQKCRFFWEGSLCLKH